MLVQLNLASGATIAVDGETVIELLDVRGEPVLFRGENGKTLIRRNALPELLVSQPIDAVLAAIRDGRDAPPTANRQTGPGRRV